MQSVQRPRAYWLASFSHSRWRRFIDEGAGTAGFRARRWKTVHSIRPGDHLLCYLTGKSRWIGLLEAASFPYLERAPLWQEVVSAPYCAALPLWEEDAFPAKVRVKPVVTLTPATAVSIFGLRKDLSLFQDLPRPNVWAARVRSSPSRWSAIDGLIVARALKAAAREATGPPATDQGVAEQNGGYALPQTAHTEIQWLLLKLGNDMGFEVWAARNDKGREYDGNRFSSLPRLRERLPLPFDEAVSRIIEHIDVLWLQGSAIVAAFEIESTTSIYSGLLRMADLVAMQPNLSIPLYLVAPDERRAKVISEVRRPAFSRLSPPLGAICRLIRFSRLRAGMAQASPFLRYLKADFLQEISESCAPDGL
ncbi:MAG: hypothetical protein M3Z21_02595 [Pseudomonadota bacterium]|nr:hypothetical protein [Pseudomonadota bacterium]